MLIASPHARRRVTQLREFLFMVRYTIGGALAALALTAAAVPAAAVQLTVTSYDMRNGNGQAVGGSFNYWDRNYTGTGSTTTDGAALAGGTGDLTDGYSEVLAWNAVENGAGTGPYVGWLASGVLNPVVTFHFTGGPTINTINITLDNSGIGGVLAPGAILIDGVSTAFTAPVFVGTVSFTGLSLSGGSHTVEFQQQPGNWAFISEVSFFGNAVPEPATWALMIAGFGMVGAAARRRNHARIAA